MGQLTWVPAIVAGMSGPTRSQGFRVGCCRLQGFAETSSVGISRVTARDALERPGGSRMKFRVARFSNPEPWCWKKKVDHIRPQVCTWRPHCPQAAAPWKLWRFVATAQPLADGNLSSQRGQAGADFPGSLVGNRRLPGAKVPGSDGFPLRDDAGIGGWHHAGASRGSLDASIRRPWTATSTPQLPFHVPQIE